MDSVVRASHQGHVKRDSTDTYGRDKKFERCYNGTGGTLVANTIIMEKPDATANYEGLELDAPAIDNLNFMKGVVDAAIANGEWGYVQTEGYRSAVSVNSTTDIAVGDSLKGVDGQTYAVKDAARGTDSTYRRHIVALAARTDNDTGTIAGMIHCGGR